MPLDLTYPALLGLFPEHLDPKRRSESASFGKYALYARG